MILVQIAVDARGQQSRFEHLDEGFAEWLAWDAERNQLYFGDFLVKHFKLPSPNQIAILMAFEEDQWPARIDDPLPGAHEVDPKDRLRYTIKSLNKHQKIKAIHFTGDGSGQGICWNPLLDHQELAHRSTKQSIKAPHLNRKQGQDEIR